MPVTVPTATNPQEVLKSFESLEFTDTPWPFSGKWGVDAHGDSWIVFDTEAGYVAAGWNTNLMSPGPWVAPEFQ